MEMASKGNEKEVDYVSKQANLTAQIESERQAAKKWWDEYGLCYLENARQEDFTYDNRVLALKKKLDDSNSHVVLNRFHHAALHTTSTDYGCRPPFKECRKKI